MKNLLYTIRRCFSRELASHVAARLGESEAAVGKALGGVVPMVLCQLIARAAGNNEQAVYGCCLAAKQAGGRDMGTVTSLLGVLGSGMATGGALQLGDALLFVLFDCVPEQLAQFVATYAGVKPASGAALLKLVAAVLAALVGQFIVRQNVKAGQLRPALVGARHQAYAWLPRTLTTWPGRRVAAPTAVGHAAWAAEIARPYWLGMLLAVVLATLVLVLNNRRVPPLAVGMPLPTLLAVHSSNPLGDGPAFRGGADQMQLQAPPLAW